MYDEDKKLKRKQERAREHPLRLKLLSLYEQDEGRSLAAKDLKGDLDEDASLSTVAYHALVLQEAELLPKSA